MASLKAAHKKARAEGLTLVPSAGRSGFLHVRHVPLEANPWKARHVAADGRVVHLGYFASAAAAALAVARRLGADSSAQAAARAAAASPAGRGGGGARREAEAAAGPPAAAGAAAGGKQKKRRQSGRPAQRRARAMLKQAATGEGAATS